MNVLTAKHCRVWGGGQGGGARGGNGKNLKIMLSIYSRLHFFDNVQN